MPADGSSGRRSDKSRRAAARCRRGPRVVGAGTAVGAFLAFGTAPLAAAPPARADVEDMLIDQVTELFDPSTWADATALGQVWDTLSDPHAWDGLSRT